MIGSTQPAPTTPSFTAEDARALSAQGEDEDALRRDTTRLRESLDGLGRRTLLLPADVSRRVREAEDSMGRAATSLGNADLPAALPAEEEALRLLRQSRDSMEGSGQGFGQSLFAKGSAKGSMPGGAPIFGSNTGPTRLPRVEDYRPPKEFREDLLRALEEKYPSRDRGLIEEYFKRWKK